MRIQRDINGLLLLLLLYFKIVKPKLEYASIVWNSVTFIYWAHSDKVCSWVEEWKPNLMSLAIFYFTYYALNMFRTLIYPSSGACDCVAELPPRSSCSQFVVCWSFCCGWYLVVFVLRVEAVLQPAKRTLPNISRSKNSNTQWTENKTTDVVIQQHSRRLLKMDILMSETCWAPKWNKIASDIKLVFHSSTLSLCSSLNVSDQVSHPYKTKGRITVLYILIFKFLDSKLEDKRFCTEW